MCDYDIIVGQETWLSSEINNNELVSDTQYNVIRKDRSQFHNKRQRGGGVIIFMKQSFVAYEIASSEKTICEIVAIRIKLSDTDKFVCIVNVYMPPYGNRVTMINEIERFVLAAKNTYVQDFIIVIGDFNLSKIQWEYSIDESNVLVPKNCENLKRFELAFYQKLTGCGLAQTNSHRNSQGNFLDLVFVSNAAMTTVNIPDDTQWLDRESIHHRPLEIFFASGLILNIDSSKQRICKNIHHEYLTNALENTNINELLYNDGLIKSDSPDIFAAVLNGLQEDFTKITKMKVHACNSNHPWTKSKKYKALFKMKRYFQRMHSKFNSIISKTNLREINIKLALTYNEMKGKYYEKLIQESSANGKEFFNSMRQKTKAKPTLPHLMHLNGTYFSGNERYSAIMTNLMSCFAQNQEQFATNHLQFSLEIEQIHSDFFDENFNHLWINFDDFITIDEVHCQIAKIKTNKDPGPMFIDASVIKRNAAFLAPFICDIFNKIFATGCVPDSWKKSFIVPIPKKGDIQDIANYRGISLQSVLPKLFDGIITRKLQKHINPWIVNTQHGFIERRSTTSNLLEFSHEIFSNMQRRHETHCIYIDFSKAFDVVSHILLAKKLAAIGTPLNFIRIIIHFIIGRSYALKADGVIANDFHGTKSSVPQGSSIGPVLFLVMVNDINQCCHGHVRSLQYADDLKLFVEIKSPCDAFNLQQTIDSIYQWSRNNEISINVGKTKFVIFKPKPNTAQTYFLGVTPIEQLEVIKDLGVTFDKDLTFKPHIKNITTKMSQITAVSYRFVREVHDVSLLRKIAITYLYPLAEYCNVIWSQRRITIERAIEKSIHTITRSVLKTAYHTNHPMHVNYGERLKKLGMISLTNRRRMASVLFACKLYKGEIDTPLSQFVRSQRYGITSTRNPLLFNTRRNLIHMNSPISICIYEANFHRALFKIGNSSDTIKSKLKKYYTRVS